MMPMPPHHLLFNKNPEWFDLSDAILPSLSWEKGGKRVSISIISIIKTDVQVTPSHLEDVSQGHCSKQCSSCTVYTQHCVHQKDAGLLFPGVHPHHL